MKASLVRGALALVTLTFAASAAADSMDPAIERLIANPDCLAGSAARPGQAALLADGEFAECQRDDVAFKRLMSQWGFAFAPTAMHSARTTGFGGFHLSIEGQYTSIDRDAEYWREGTRGPDDPSSGLASVVNDKPQPILQLYSLKLRKSFGFGLEVTGAVGFMPKTNLMSGGADIRISLLEGFRPPDLPGYLPDVAVGGGVRTITGTPEFQLTVASLDAQISKPIPIAHSSQLIPWVGYQFVWIFADSGLVDLTPGTDPLAACNYQGPNVPGSDTTPSDGSADPAKTSYDGQPVCGAGGARSDFNNNSVFDNARFERQRGILGLAYRYEMVMVGAELLFDLVAPGKTQSGDDTTAVRDESGDVIEEIDDSTLLEDEPAQWALVFELGAMF